MNTGVAIPHSVLRALYDRSGAAGWDVPLDVFSARVEGSVARRFSGESPAATAVEAFARSLHVEDLALACACAAGHERAWEHFIRELRPSLYAACRQMTGAPQELADSIFGELYGVDVRGRERRSLLDYYHGRAKLSTWLRTVLAQRHVDGIRASAKSVPLDEADAIAGRPDPRHTEPGRAEHVALVQRALDTAVASLDPRDRLRLRLYYGQGLKLAAIGKMLREHEGTVSRKLERTRGDIRRAIERTLRSEQGLSSDAVGEWLAQASGAPELDISRALTDDP